jgi:hypothetical protein
MSYAVPMTLMIHVSCEKQRLILLLCLLFLARSILRTYIDEGRVSAKQRAGTRLRFITEEEAEMIREMKRRHPLITYIKSCFK